MSPSKPTSASEYIQRVYRRESGNRRFSCSENDFITSVKAAVLLQDRSINPEKFFLAIDQALITDQQQEATGQKVTAFKSCPQYPIFIDAIRDAVADQLVKPETKKKCENLEDDQPIEDDPHAWIIVAEQAAALQQAIKRLEPMDRKIVQLLYFDPACDTQASVAAKLKCSPKTVSRRLEKILARLRDELKHLEPN